MKTTFSGRRQWILEDNPYVAEIMDVFPPMKKMRYLRREFQLILEKEISEPDTNHSTVVERSVRNFSALIARINRLANLEAKGNKILAKLLDDHAAESARFGGDADAKKSLEAIQAFEQLTCLLANRKSTKAQMVHRFSLDSDAQAIKSANHPYLAVAVASAGSIQVCIVVERMILATTDDFSEALFMLMSAYFAFNMEYPAPFKALMLFIQHLVMEVKDAVPLPSSATRVFSALHSED